jgi:UDP-hydrolysing UDP-N-acetyl-D-glucosamine 2-epimerase
MKKICIITGTRADYGLLQNIISLVSKDTELQLQLIATGMHLCPVYGSTIDAIRADGHKIDKELDILLNSNSKVSVAKSMGLGTIAFSQALEELKPDIIVVLGDRFEIFSAVQSAMILNIPVAHIHGGEVTEGAFDDMIRHAITKMSHIHFPSSEVYKNRILQLGEKSKNVFNVGAPGIDNILNLELLSKTKLGEALNVDFSQKRPIFLITYHPVTSNSGEVDGIDALLDKLKSYPDTIKLFTRPNCDPNSNIISQKVEHFVKQDKNSYIFTSMGQLKYLSAMKYCSAVIGNSSSGVIEAPYFNVPTIDIGTRQGGRIKPSTVIQCMNDKKSIDKAFLTLQNFEKLSNKELKNLPYGDGKAAERIVEKLKEINYNNLLHKKFYDR